MIDLLMRFRRLAWPLGVTLLASCTGNGLGPGRQGPGNPDGATLQLVTVADGFDDPIFLTAPAGDGRLFVAEQPGRMWVVNNGVVLATPFLDIRGQVLDGGERGLLSFAFHPDYATNGLFYVSYTDQGGDSRIERYTVSSDPNVADAGSGVDILSVQQPQSNHNGGLILFGPDDMLYFGLGDGGGSGDPDDEGQDISTLLGSMLRLDVDGGFPFAIPGDNPFVGAAGRDEIWIYGLRNPWRFAFDPIDDNLYVADVGQNALEEVTVVRSDLGGLNFGWNVMEGSQCFGAGGCDMTGLTLPALDYPNPGDGCAVVGGYVYRGTANPSIVGHYFYSDACSGWLRSFRYDNGSVVDQLEWDVGQFSPLSFGQDAVGELYILSGDGRVLQIVEQM